MWDKNQAVGLTKDAVYFMLVCADSSNVTTAKMDDISTVLPQSSISNTFLLASPSDFDSSGSVVYEISSISPDGIVIHTDPHIEEIKVLSTVCALWYISNQLFSALCKAFWIQHLENIANIFIASDGIRPVKCTYGLAISRSWLGDHLAISPYRW